MSSGDYVTTRLSPCLAMRNIETITMLANTIPGVEYAKNDLLAEEKDGRQMHAKWLHSLVTLEADKPVAFIMAYERASENNRQYLEDSIYISELAVSAQHRRRGLATSLMTQLLRSSNRLGMTSLSGPLQYSVQTNAADWNQHVVRFYESFGFVRKAEKEYPDRTDLVLRLTADTESFSQE